jgi:hypothetical protein
MRRSSRSVCDIIDDGDCDSAVELAVAPEPAQLRLIDSFDGRRAGPVNLIVRRFVVWDGGIT